VRGMNAISSRHYFAGPAWRPRRSCWGELVQWDTSEHAWLEGRGEKLYLIAMLDDATSRARARLVRHPWTRRGIAAAPITSTSGSTLRPSSLLSEWIRTHLQ